jgi:hypothetical protein
MANPKQLFIPNSIIEPEMRFAVLYAEGDPIYASDASSDGVVTNLFVVRPGMKVIRAGVKVTTAASPTGTTLNIGDSDDTDRLLATASVTEASLGSYGNDPIFTYMDSDPSYIQAVVLTTGSATGAAGTFVPFIEYIPHPVYLP